MSRKATNKGQMSRKSTRSALLLVVGSVFGIFILLFGMANDDWVAIAMPSAPWSDYPSWPVFESRLWTIMLVSFVSGACIAWIGSAISRWQLTQKASRAEERIKKLELEIEKTNRLLSATRKSR